ncbi:MAG TPA: protein translocase subunit SecF [Bryobacteraceae bacterium]|nr:protein translocase subunit SecF [Bryobacteraceae bacterium]
MELFKNTNYDFLGKKWPFIGLSLVLSVAGIISLIAKGGPRYGIDFKGGALVRVRFAQRPPVERVRAALAGKLPVDVQEITNGAYPEDMVGTDVQNDQALDQAIKVIVTSLDQSFGQPSSGKLDINNSGITAIADRLRDPLQRAGVSMNDQQIAQLSSSIMDYVKSHGGLVRNIDEMRNVPGVTPQVLNVMKQECYAAPFTILGREMVGPKVGADLQHKALMAVLYALGGMLVYIAFRFEWIYGVAAVVAVFHDTIITIGLFSIFGKEISLTVVAALLTLVGYSMNDTIVVFDRIRENLKILRREPLESVINKSVNQTLSRTVLTSGLTLLTALALFLFGGTVLNGFSFALVCGIIVGTYSSIFVASPILIFWQDFIESRKKRKPAPVPVAPVRESNVRRGAAKVK